MEPRSPTLQGDSLLAKSPGKPKNTGVGSLSLLQIFPTQELNWDLLHCRQILYQLSYQGGPNKFNKDFKTGPSKKKNAASVPPASLCSRALRPPDSSLLHPCTLCGPGKTSGLPPQRCPRTQHSLDAHTCLLGGWTALISRLRTVKRGP